MLSKGFPKAAVPCSRAPRPTSAHSDTSATAPARPAFSILDAASSSDRDAYSREVEGPPSRPARPLSYRAAGVKAVDACCVGPGQCTLWCCYLKERMSIVCTMAGMTMYYGAAMHSRTTGLVVLCYGCVHAPDCAPDRSPPGRWERSSGPPSCRQAVGRGATGALCGRALCVSATSLVWYGLRQARAGTLLTPNDSVPSKCLSRLQSPVVAYPAQRLAHICSHRTSRRPVLSSLSNRANGDRTHLLPH